MARPISTEQPSGVVVSAPFAVRVIRELLRHVLGAPFPPVGVSLFDHLAIGGFARATSPAEFGGVVGGSLDNRMK